MGGCCQCQSLESHWGAVPILLLNNLLFSFFFMTTMETCGMLFSLIR